MKPRVLLAHALLWPNIARLSCGFHDVGFEVGAIAVARHPVHRMRSPARTFLYEPSAPRDSLREAICSYRPELVVPCDDRVLGHLSGLHQAADRSPDKRVAEIIERSLGRQTSIGRLAKRAALAELSELPDVNVPRTQDIGSVGELRDWVRRYQLPAMLKLDGSWGGRDVVRVDSESGIALAYAEMRLRSSALLGFKRMALNNDPESWFSRSNRPAISVQAYAHGRPANLAVACWRGQIVAQIAVEVVCPRNAFSAATVVRLVEGDEMVAAARSIARHFGFSGIYGFDFILEDVTGVARLVEINPRATQTPHLPFGEGRDLPAALYAAVSGQIGAGIRPGLAACEVALFPKEWLRNGKSAYLTSAYHDVPRDEPELLRFYGYDEMSENAVDGGPSSFAARIGLLASMSLRRLPGFRKDAAVLSGDRLA